MQSKKVKIFKLITLAAFIIIMILLTVWLIPIFKNISTEEGRLNLKNEIDALGVKGIYAIIGLMVAQIFLPILPRRASRGISRNVLWTNWRTFDCIFRCIYE